MAKLYSAVRGEPVACRWCDEPLAEAVSLLWEGRVGPAALVLFLCEDCGETIQEVLPGGNQNG